MKQVSLVNMAKLSVLSTTILMITGCATTTGLSKSQCEQLAQNSTDWRTLGEQDGLMGRGADYFGQHLQACNQKLNMLANVMTTSTVLQSKNQQLWEQGRQAGLKKYCTPLRAYQLGREGFSYQNVCPQEQMVELLKANDEGLYNYQREQNLRGWDDDFFPFGWGYGRGYGGWNRWHGGHYYVPASKSLPHYAADNDIAKK